MNYEESIAYLEAAASFGIKPGLERIEAILERLDHPEKAYKVIHVTGTNGKGSVVAMITSVLDYVSYHYMEDIKVEDLANICHISETHFRRVFTSYMKMSPLEYINTVRVYTACELLETTDAPVADVAHKCGFTTNSTFNRNFKQLMGVTPLEWRKRPESYEQQLLRFDIHSEKGW